LKSIFLFSLFWVATSALAQNFTETFAASPLLGGQDPGSTATPGLWYVDRYAPAAFESASFQGTNRLHVGTLGSDYQSDSFYNWQGRKLYLTGATLGSTVSAQLYISSTWQNLAASPGMWFTLYDSSSTPADYPTISFYTTGTGVNYFRVFDNLNGWVALDTPILWDSWTTLSVSFDLAGIVYSINGTEVYSETTGLDNGAVSIANVMFQNRNFGTNYDAFWYNLQVTTPTIIVAPVPEPTTLALVGMGAATLLRRGLRAKR
jgi:hypothetical protein